MQMTSIMMLASLPAMIMITKAMIMMKTAAMGTIRLAMASAATDAEDDDE